MTDNTLTKAEARLCIEGLVVAANEQWSPITLLPKEWYENDAPENFFEDLTEKLYALAEITDAERDMISDSV